MVPKPATLAAIALLAAACGGVSSETAPPPSPDVGSRSAASPIADDPPQGSPRIVDSRPVWGGFAATNDHPGELAAYLHGPLDVYEKPGEGDPFMTVEPATILGTVTVLAVVDATREGWVEVMLPVRPNGSTGWVEADQVSFYVADSVIVVDLEERELTYLIDGVEALRTEVGIGSKYNETPPGHYFVTDVVTLANPNSPWGPHALGISARSETITEFNGGDGIIGIHGTNNPGSIGGNISLGCVRLPNEMITALHDMVPIGTRVEINA